MLRYNVDNSAVGTEVALLKSPFKLNPGEFVELRTCNTLVLFQCMNDLLS